MSSELKISAASSVEEYQKLLKALEGTGAKRVSSDDYEQLDYPLEQMYIDYALRGEVFTLHREHTLGIFLLSDALSVVELEEIASRIRQG